MPVTVTPEATYCGTFSEGRELLDEPRFKAQLSFVPGSYMLPSTDGDHMVAFPVCATFADGSATASTAATGTLRITSNTFDGTRYVNMHLEQPLSDGWILQGDLRVQIPSTGMPATIAIDGTHGLFDATSSSSWSLCKDRCDDFVNVRRMDSCAFTSGQLQRHTITFTGGRAELDMRIGMSFAGTEPGAFVEARGTLDGTDFTQRGYWKLIYNPEHHHFVRNYLVLFDAPIGGACGVKFEGIPAFDMNPQAHAATVDCDLSEIETRAIVSTETFREMMP